MQRLDRPHQQGLSREERLDNIKDAFSLTDLPPSKHLIIFDDVVTTGSTVASAARLLITNTPKLRIISVCLAHGSADFGLDRA